MSLQARAGQGAAPYVAGSGWHGEQSLLGFGQAAIAASATPLVPA